MSRIAPVPATVPGAAVSLVSQPVPSGLKTELFEVLIDEVNGETWLRFRFLAPAIGDRAFVPDFERIQGDFEFLCNEFALAYLTDFALTADVIVVALLDRPIEFGQPDPDATQFIEAFRVTPTGCEWEGMW